MPSFLKKAKTLLEKYKYLLIVVAAGIILLLLPTGGGTSEEAPKQVLPVMPETQLEEARLERALSSISGVGRVNATLTIKSSAETIYAMDERLSEKNESEPASDSKEKDSKPAIISKQSGGQDALIIKQVLPQYKGALIVCDGADESSVKLKIVEAVSSLLGLGSDKIVVLKMRT